MGFYSQIAFLVCWGLVSNFSHAAIFSLCRQSLSESMSAAQWSEFSPEAKGYAIISLSKLASDKEVLNWLEQHLCERQAVRWDRTIEGNFFCEGRQNESYEHLLALGQDLERLIQEKFSESRKLVQVEIRHSYGDWRQYFNLGPAERPHVDGRAITISLTLVGPGTEILDSGGLVPSQAGDLVILSGAERQKDLELQHPEFRATKHKVPESDAHRVLILFRFD